MFSYSISSTWSSCAILEPGRKIQAFRIDFIPFQTHKISKRINTLGIL